MRGNSCLRYLNKKLKDAGYFSNKEIAYALGCAIGNDGIPLLCEGDPGVGKTALAVALAKALDIPLIRLQCYEGISAETILYDFDYQRQMLVANLLRTKIEKELKNTSISDSIKSIAGNVEFYGEDFLIERPILKAIRQKGRKVLLIDEIDKTSEEVEHMLLEFLSDFSLTIPEYGTISCTEENRPIVILTSNTYRDLSEPMKRRCAYLYLKKKTMDEIKDILQMHVECDETFLQGISQCLYDISNMDGLRHQPSISEGIEWAKYLTQLISEGAKLDEALFSVSMLGKNKRDQEVIKKKVAEFF